ncbi:MAG TPA: type II toxin-antitoxin system Phd/YefM family antitoxin [Verrucomicrobiales bacterium]|jgi:prevent-host-death family protein|nr:type II toxin-antitoxin system Phd/YefM family antitoxin [Verrucomicrobiales bacterium]HIL70596.1 type II toxin-antitoxin system Phd/YefM family antitoxin [Verrucomicrobiota bacterium]
MKTRESQPLWSVRDAKSKLSELLRLAREQGPQYIGKHNPCVVIAREEWEARIHPEEGLASWLLKNSPKVEFDLPPRGRSTSRKIPFAESDS